MAVTTGPVYVPAPNPTVPRYGLFSAATGPLDLPVHARNGGVQYEVGTCELPVGYEVNCQASHASKTFNGAITTHTGYPFVVYSAIECSPVGLANYGETRIRQFLYEQLVAGEQATAERIFSVSSFGQTLGLANNPNVVDLGTAIGIVRGVGMLEDWLYNQYGLPGVLHVPMKAAPYVPGASLLADRSSPMEPWRLPTRTVVSFGNYAGTGPTGDPVAANTAWIYITGQVAVWRTPDSQLLGGGSDPIPLGQVLNRATNVVDIVMEREYVISYDCYVAAVLVTLDTTYQ